MFTDLKELRKLILENEDCKLVIFCGEDANSGTYQYETDQNIHYRVCEMAEYKGTYDNYVLDKEEYEERLADDMCYKPKYEKMSEEDFFEEVKKKMEKIQFEKVISITVG